MMMNLKNTTKTTTMKTKTKNTMTIHYKPRM